MFCVSAVPSETVVPVYREGLAPRNLPSPHADAAGTSFPANEISD